VVCGYAAGGLTDSSTRVIWEEAKKFLGVGVLVQNKPGASGMVGISYIISSARPDGYTLGAATDSDYLRSPHMLKLNFNPIKDTLPLIIYASTNNFIVVPKDSPLKTFKDLIDFAKANPGKLTYGHAGLGSAMYMAFAGVAQQLGLNVGYVTFPGDAPNLLAALGGHVMSAGISAAPCVPQIKAGKLRALAVTNGEERIEAHPSGTDALRVYPTSECYTTFRPDDLWT